MGDPNDVYEVVVAQRYTSNYIANVFHLQDTLGTMTSQTIADDVATNLISSTPGWRTNVSQFLHFDNVIVRKIVPRTLELGTHLMADSGVLAATQAVPTVACGVVTWRTGTAGRRGRGRTYFGGLVVGGTDAANAGVLNSTGASNLGFVAAKWVARYTDIGAPAVHASLRLGVYSRADGVVGGVWTVAGFRRVTGYTVQAYIAAMGSRRFGRGI